MDTQVLGTPRLADDIDASPPDQRNAFTTALFFAGKLIVSAACFWYALRQINVSEAVRTLPTFDFHWAAFAVAVAMAQILLLALRLWSVVHALTPNAARLTYLATCVSMWNSGSTFFQPEARPPIAWPYRPGVQVPALPFKRPSWACRCKPWIQ